MIEMINKTDFAYSRFFLNNEEGFNNYSQSLNIIEKKLTSFLKGNNSPYSGKKPYEIEARLKRADPCFSKREDNGSGSG